MKAKAMTPRWRAFCESYVATGDVTKSYRDNYSTCKTDAGAHVNGTRLLQKPEIQEYIQELMEKVASPKIAEAEEVLQFLTAAMRDGDSRYAERIKAAELLGKRYKLFTDRVETTGVVQVIFEGEEELED